MAWVGFDFIYFLVVFGLQTKEKKHKRHKRIKHVVVLVVDVEDELIN